MNEKDKLLSQLKFYGIISKYLALYHYYLDNKHFRTAIYDSDNSNKVSSWAKVRHGVPHGSVLGPLLLLLLDTNDLTKIINRTSAPIIFADDTSILFAHSNLKDFNKNIHIIFATLNKWFRANQLSLNFNKTNYVHFTTKKNMSVKFKIGLNNNLITNSSYTKFLGVTMDNTLSWNNHIDLLMKKLSVALYIIRNGTTYMSALSSKMIYRAFFHSAMSYGIIFWGNLLHSSQFLTCKKRQLELRKDVGIEFHVEIYLRNYKFCL